MAKISAFPHLDGLFDLACRSGIDVRPTLLRVLTDLYVQKSTHTAEEEAQYVELAQRLIETVDAPSRAAVAARLAAYPAAPAVIFDRLAELIGASRLPSTHAANSAAEVQASDLLDAFFSATSDERRLILAHLDATEAARSRHSPPPAPETCRRLEAAALERNGAEFTRLIENALVVPRTLAERIVTDPAGEPLLVAVRALGMTQDTVQRILLFLNPVIGHSVQRVYELSNLYEEFSAKAADAMIDMWRGRSTRRQGAHQSVHYDDEQRSARASSSTSRYRSTRRSDSLAARFKSTGR